MAGARYPVLFAGQRLTATLLSAGLPIIARKNANEAAPTSSTVLQDDDELFCSVEANASYAVWGWYRHVATGAVPDLKINYSYPAGSTFGRSDWGVPVGTVSVADNIDTNLQSTGDTARGADANPRSIYMQGDLVVGGTPGTFRVRFSQNTSDAATVTMLSASRIILQRYA